MAIAAAGAPPRLLTKPLQAALPHLEAGASVMATGSAAAFMNALPLTETGRDPGGMG